MVMAQTFCSNGSVDILECNCKSNRNSQVAHDVVYCEFSPKDINCIKDRSISY